LWYIITGTRPSSLACTLAGLGGGSALAGVDAEGVAAPDEVAVTLLDDAGPEVVEVAEVADATGAEVVLVSAAAEPLPDVQAVQASPTAPATRTQARNRDRTGAVRRDMRLPGRLLNGLR
jgi:hypothetical protein